MFSFGDELNVMAYAGASVASTAFYTGALVLLRVATLCLYQDMIFNQTRHWRFSIVLGIILTVYSLVFVIADALQCKPNTSHKDLSRCINISDLEIVVGYESRTFTESV
jgi:K+-transporting ATPase A subunit